MTQGSHWRSPEAQRWQKLYKTNRWKSLRSRVLIRDGYRCQRCKVLLTTGRTRPTAAVVHHIKPHKGDDALFHDAANCEAVCKQCHDGAIQADEARGYSTDIGEDGWPLDPAHPFNRGSA